jgi:hypothetical protein
MRGGVNQLDKFIVRRIADSIVVSITFNAIRWIGKEFVNQNVAARLATEFNQYWIAISTVSTYDEFD